MTDPIRLTLPLKREDVKKLRAGDLVLLSGTMLTGRDAAHKRLFELIQQGKELPVSIADQCIFYTGPTPAAPGRPIGSAGPTSSYRMDKYAPLLMDHGLLGMVGKGLRSREVKDAMVRNGCVYFGATGGSGALLSLCIKAAEVVAYPDLGTEAVRKITVEDFPAIVIVDSTGKDLYESGPAKYAKA
ncbi:MAG TPA: Fe-S-containing hydro-lyase [Chloroflexota bacterium]|nr:Fe-S-containing hydro-lyase [Chloroflexota bacterium]